MPGTPEGAAKARAARRTPNHASVILRACQSERTTADLCRITGLSAKQVRRYLSELREAGRIVNHGTQRALWRTVAAPRRQDRRRLKTGQRVTLQGRMGRAIKVVDSSDVIIEWDDGECEIVPRSGRVGHGVYVEVADDQ